MNEQIGNSSSEPHGGNVWKASREINICAGVILEFSANLYVFGPDLPVELLSRPDLLRSYPDSDLAAYTDGLSAHAGVSSQNLILGPGLTYLIYRFCQSHSGEGAIIAEPAFSEYRRACFASGIKVEDFTFSSDQDIIDRIEQGNHDIIFLATPSNPIGNILGPESLNRILEASIENEVTVFLDEAFSDFASGYDASYSARLATESDNLVIGRSLTKLLGLASLRLGYLIASDSVKSQISRVIEPWTIGQNVLEFLSQVNFEQFSTLPSLVEEERKRVGSAFEKLGFSVVGDPRANYILLELPPKVERSMLDSFLKSRGILVKFVPGVPGTNNTCMRIAIKKRVRNQILSNVIEKFMASLK